MKLKKIASLALAGVMAVSMLAGCSAASNDPEQPTVPTVTTKSAGTSSQLKDGLTAGLAAKFTFSDSTALNSALDKASNYVSASIIAGAYDSYIVADMAAFVPTESSVDNSVMLAAAVVEDEMKAENDLTDGELHNTFVQLYPSTNLLSDSRNITLFFAVNGRTGIAAAMDQVASQISSELYQLPLDNDEINEDQTESTLRYSYTISASANTITLDGDHDKSLTLIAVNVARGF